MTIAACYACPEGVVIGADSTSTWMQPGLPDHFYNHEQKVFEIGCGSTLAICMWGVGSLGHLSYRRMIADLADDIAANPVKSVEEAAQRWCARFWPVYLGVFTAQLARCRDLERISPRSESEETELRTLRSICGGFCVAGHVLCDRTPRAFEMLYGPQLPPPVPREIHYGEWAFWGCPNITQRLVYGMEDNLFREIVGSGKWTGSPDELFDLIRPQVLKPPGLLPLREAIDWVYSSIFVTIKAMKFSSLSQVCGGPIEVAAISADREFRWVSHKGLDEAISHRPYSQRPIARRDH